MPFYDRMALTPPGQENHEGIAMITEEAQQCILRLENLSKSYRTTGGLLRSSDARVVALDNLSFSIYRGEVFGLVGESGSGKTTCGRLIVKLEDAEQGRIYLDGSDIIGFAGRKLKNYRRKVQMIFQDPYQSLNPQFSIFESVAEPLIIHRIGDSAQRTDRVLKTLRTVGLSPPEDYIYRYPHQLSGGQRQRVAIARAMVLEPELLVADEPTSMLDASYSAQIFNILLYVREKFHVTILFITHSLAAARYLSDRICVIYRGHLMEIGPAEEIIQNPRHPYTQALLDALPKFGHCGDVRPYDTFLTTERPAPESVGCPFFVRCKRAHRLRCSREYPPLTNIDTAHFAACFYTEPGPQDKPESKECYYGI
jgi:peptide/nickel transport system ATP-binding protein